MPAVAERAEPSPYYVERERELTALPGDEPKDDFDNEDHDRPRRRVRRRKNSNTKLVVGISLGCAGLLVLVGGAIAVVAYFALAPTSFPEQTEDYVQARSHFQTHLLVRRSAPQDNWIQELPPRDVREIAFRSGALKLKAWVSEAPLADKGKLPAVLFLHNGFAFGADDWQQAQPFRDAGYVVMIPTLRGENGQAGDFTLFYDEVDDVLAAADALAALPYVDADRLYLAGHSSGGTLTLLAAMTSKRFRAAAAFSGSPDQVAFIRDRHIFVPFDRNNQLELQMRSPLAYARSFKCPLRMYYGDEEVLLQFSSQKTADKARAANLDVEAESVPGDHMSAVAPAMHKAIAFFRQKS
jgi:dienelactone hydrolase